MKHQELTDSTVGIALPLPEPQETMKTVIFQTLCCAGKTVFQIYLQLSA